jgi:hypothetical protein
LIDDGFWSVNFSSLVSGGRGKGEGEGGLLRRTIVGAVIKRRASFFSFKLPLAKKEMMMWEKILEVY